MRPQDCALYCFKAPAYREAALLLFPRVIHRHHLLDSFFESSRWWQQLKHDFRHGEISLVTEVHTTHRWALDYRTSNLFSNACYVVNAHDIGMAGIASDFVLHHSSGSGATIQSPPNNTYAYTILAKHCRTSRHQLIEFPHYWLVTIKR